MYNFRAFGHGSGHPYGRVPQFPHVAIVMVERPRQVRGKFQKKEQSISILGESEKFSGRQIRLQNQKRRFMSVYIDGVRPSSQVDGS